MNKKFVYQVGNNKKVKSTSYCCWGHKFPLKTVLCNFQYFYIVGSDMCLKPCVSIATLVTRTRRNVTLSVHCLSWRHTCVQSGRPFDWSVWGTRIMFLCSLSVPYTCAAWLTVCRSLLLLLNAESAVDLDSGVL
jgi:hypothetical protein